MPDPPIVQLRTEWVVQADGHLLSAKAEWTVPRNSTTSFLTATTLIYAIGAGVTAAAGTRLALQLILVKRLRLRSLQSRKSKTPIRYFLSLPPELGLGNLRACCLP